jgi:hypothetical protein
VARGADPGGRAGPWGGAAIPRRPDPTAVVPLSPAQQRLWFIEKLRPGTTVHTVPMAFRLLGDLDAGALERSLAEIVRRHEALRTTVSELDGVPVQVVRPAAITLPIDAFNKRMREAFGDHLDEYVRLRVLEEVRRPFDLVAGPLVRARLLRLAARDHVLILTAHHLVIDGWSIGVIRRELASLYAAFTGGEPSRLAEPPIQYADYALWQHERLRRGALDAEVAYWSRHLAGLEPSRLPIASPRSAEGAPRGGRRAVAIPPPLAQRLRDLARREGVTLYMALLAAYQRCSPATPSGATSRSRRPSPGGTGSKPRAWSASSSTRSCSAPTWMAIPTFRALLGRVRTVALDAFAHQEAPFDRVVAAARPERGGEPMAAGLGGLRVAQHPARSAGVARALRQPARDRSRGCAVRSLARRSRHGAGAPRVARLRRRRVRCRRHRSVRRALPDAAQRRGRRPRPGALGPAAADAVGAEPTPRRVEPEVVPIPADRTIHGLFEAQAARTPRRLRWSGKGRV